MKESPGLFHAREEKNKSIRERASVIKVSVQRSSCAIETSRNCRATPRHCEPWQRNDDPGFLDLE